MSYSHIAIKIGLQFKAGDRVSLVGDDQYTGTVKSVDEEGQAFIEWDNGKQGFTFSPVNDKIKKISKSPPVGDYIVLCSHIPLTNFPEGYCLASRFLTEQRAVAYAISLHNPCLFTYVFLNEKPVAMLDRFCRVKYFD